MLNKIKTVLTETCVLFTLLTIILYCVGFIAVNDAVTFKPSGVFTLLALSFLLSVIKRVLFIKSISIPVKILLHYLLVLAASFLLFAVIGNVVSTSLATLVLLASVTLVYSVITLIFVLRNNKKQDETNYTSMFRK